MAECQTKVELTHTLTLTDEEAEWLKAYLQNYMHDNLKPEIGQHKRIREAIFTAIHSSRIPPSGRPA